MKEGSTIPSYEQFAYVYDRLMSNMPYDDWIAVVKNSWAQFGKPKTVVDLGCGTGSLTLRITPHVPLVYGIDRSADMLSVAAQKMQAKSQRIAVQWLEQDMRDWIVPEPVDAVYSFCDSLNYMTGATDLADVFRSVHQNLKPGGVFLFDMLSEFQYESYAEEQPFILNEDELAYIWTCEYDRETKQIEHALSLFVQEDGNMYRRIDEFHQQRAYPEQLVGQLLKENGFELENITADFTDELPSSTSVRLFYTAQRS